MVLVALTVELTCVGHDIVEVTTREATIVVIAVVALYIEVDRTIRLVGIASVENALNHLDLLDDMTRSLWLDRGRLNAQLTHCIAVALRIVVCNLHRLELLEASLLCNLILAFVGILLQVAYIGNVAYVAHLVAQRLEVAEQKVEGYGWACVTQVWIAINCWAADIHTHVVGVNRLERLLATCERIVQYNLFHSCLYFLFFVIL